MDPSTKPRFRRRFRPMRLLARGLMRIGIPPEAVAIAGMLLGILAGVSFMATSESNRAELFWSLGLAFCLLRIVSIRLDTFFQQHSPEFPEHEEYFRELPERISDATTLIGFGFAAQSNPWLGLGAALAAVFSAYVRAFGMQRGAARRRAAAGPMTRSHRLILLSMTSLVIIFGPSEMSLTVPVPQMALWIIFFGCLITILIRWFRIR